MNRYCIFLRGINVGGIKVPMAELRNCLEKLGLTDITTYLQTGNVTCSSTKNQADLKQGIEKALSHNFKYDAYIVLVTEQSLRKIISSYPFDRTNPLEHHYVVLTSSPGCLQEIKAAANHLDPATEVIAMGDGVIYWRVKKGMTTKSKFGKVLSNKSYKPVTTTRNLNTLEKMIPTDRA